ncbi:unnamed protein product [Phytomonas sp. Hart1]|nr:unnamed protein product [Phytomonas sp. Hart1]|eukprot:CCW70973.1 unnamed protein product [Phytomonas sp. isolate Hart1]
MPSRLSSDAPSMVLRPNLTGDGVLSPGTRNAMNDDDIVLTALFAALPAGAAAISVKSLHAQLDVEIQEAVSERSGGLGAFLRARRHLFVVRERPTDGVLFVAASPLAIQRYAVRNIQRETMQSILGLDSRNDGPYERGRGRGRGQGRGRGRGRGDSRGRSDPREREHERGGRERGRFSREQGGGMGSRGRSFGSARF